MIEAKSGLWHNIGRLSKTSARWIPRFDIHNIIDGPLEVIPKGSIHFDVKYYNEIKDLFNLVKDINRNDI